MRSQDVSVRRQAWVYFNSHDCVSDTPCMTFIWQSNRSDADEWLSWTIPVQKCASAVQIAVVRVAPMLPQHVADALTARH